MVSWILLIVVLAALVVLGTWFWGSVFGRGEVLEPLDDPETLSRDNREAIESGRVQDVRFEVVPRGYRPEQVDEVIAQLTEQIEQARAEAAKTIPNRLSEKSD